MKKVKGVERVRVSLKEGLTILDLAPDNSVTLEALRRVIKNGGFVSKDASIVARGTPLDDRGGRAFEVSGTRERLRPSVPAERVGEGTWKLLVER